LLTGFRSPLIVSIILLRNTLRVARRQHSNIIANSSIETKEKSSLLDLLRKIAAGGFVRGNLMTYAQFPAGFNYQLHNSGQFATGSDVRSENTESFTVQITGTQLAASLNVPPNSQVFVTSPDPSFDNRQGAVIISSSFGPAITGVQTGYQTGDASTIALDPNRSLNGTLVIQTSAVTPGQHFTLPNNTPDLLQSAASAVHHDRHPDPHRAGRGHSQGP
jgi:hypothetical protein